MTKRKAMRLIAPHAMAVWPAQVDRVIHALRDGAKVSVIACRRSKKSS
jgi:hypothetical protein